MLTQIFTCDRCAHQAIERTETPKPTKWTKVRVAAPEGGYEWYLCDACTAAFDALAAAFGIRLR